MVQIIKPSSFDDNLVLEPTAGRFVLRKVKEDRTGSGIHTPMGQLEANIMKGEIIALPKDEDNFGFETGMVVYCGMLGLMPVGNQFVGFLKDIMAIDRTVPDGVDGEV